MIDRSKRGYIILRGLNLKLGLQAVHHRHVQSTICANKFFNDHAIHYLIDANDLLQARSISESSNRQRAFKERECIHHTDRCLGLTCISRFRIARDVEFIARKSIVQNPQRYAFIYIRIRSIADLCSRTGFRFI